MRYAVLLLFVLALAPALVVAAPPGTVFQENTYGGFELVYPKIPAYRFGEPATLHFHVFDISGLPVTNATASCYLHVYGLDGGHILRQNLTYDGAEFEIDLNTSVLNHTGEYPYLAACENATAGGFVSGYFYVTNSGLPYGTGEDLSPIAVTLLAPFLLAFLLLVGSALLSKEEHSALKIGLFLGSGVPFAVGVWWAVEAIGRWYEAPAFVEAIGQSTFYLTVTFGLLLLFYFVVYFIYKAFESIRESKRRRLEY